MGKKRFRIIIYDDGEKKVYDTRIKSWFGWVSFSVYYKKYILHLFSDPVEQISLAYDRIDHYCLLKGHNRDDISITEVNNSF